MVFMEKIAITPFSLGEGHLTRMLKVYKEMMNSAMRNNYEFHFCVDSPLYERLAAGSREYSLHKIKNPKWVETGKGPDTWASLRNLFLPVGEKESIFTEIKQGYRGLRELYNQHKFDFVLSDGDLMSIRLAHRRGVPNMLVTNQISPRLYAPNKIYEPVMPLIRRGMNKADLILIPDEKRPYTICEYGLGDLDYMGLSGKTEFSGLFADSSSNGTVSEDLKALLSEEDYVLFSVTGSRGTKEITISTYTDSFGGIGMRKVMTMGDPKSSVEPYVVSRRGERFSLDEARKKHVDWDKLFTGYFSNPDKDFAFRNANIVVTSGSHNVCGEIALTYGKPTVGTPIYDEHMNNLAKMRDMGTAELARNNFLSPTNPRKLAETVERMYEDMDNYSNAATDLKSKLRGGGVKATVDIVRRMLQK
jgi:hypothetical protein